jgi:hypothetical protein
VASRIAAGLLRTLVEEKGDRTLAELASAYEERTRDRISISSVFPTLARKGVVRNNQMYPNTGGKAITTIAAHTA